MKTFLFAVCFALSVCVIHCDGADIALAWIDNSTGTTLAKNFRVFKQGPAGISLPGLSGLWTQIAIPARTADVSPTTPEHNQYYVLNGMAEGTYSLCIVAANDVGNAPPSNVSTVTVIPPAPTGPPQQSTGFTANVLNP